MARKRYSDEDILKLLREIELKLADGDDVRTACRGVGGSDGSVNTLTLLNLAEGSLVEGNFILAEDLLL